MVAGTGFNYACIWHPDGTPEFLPVSSGFNQSQANAVNNQGTVVGAAVWPDGTRSFVWNGGSFTFIDHWSHGLTSCGACDISEAGHVCGQVAGKWGVNYRGFRWKDGVLEVLEPLPGAQDCTAYAVNSDGVAVGFSRYYFKDDKSYNFLPTMWVGTEAIALPLQPGYTQGACIDISDLGTLLGVISVPDVSGLPASKWVTWLNSVPIDIKAIIATPNPSQMGAAWGINDRDQIVAKGKVTPPGATGVWILTPERVEADLNGDCEVDGADLAALLEAWGSRRQGHPADLTGDGNVSGADLGLLLARWTS
ncbi:MAG: hypothetical protein JNK53_05550 [Phycisphaerae bacterium]|nr:hypothetical protein [Phycisphaerae bacterium]